MAGYGTDAGFTAWLAANGYTNTSSLAPAVLRERGSAYLDGHYGDRFTGTPTDGIAQERAWPRTNAFAYGVAIDSTSIPSAVVNASYAAAWAEASAPGSLSVVGSAASAVKREKVEGAVEVEYHSQSGAWTAESLVPVLTVVEGLLRPFLTKAADFPAVLVV